MLEELLTLTNILITVSLIMNLVTLIIVINFTKKNKAQNDNTTPNKNNNWATTETQEGVVFCRNCGNKSDSSSKVCKYCHAER